MKAKKMSLFFLFFPIFCSESEDDGPKEKINWRPLIAQVQQKGNIIPTQEEAFRVIKTGVRCFLNTPYDSRFRTEEVSLDDIVFNINERGVLECTSFVGIIKAILCCRKSKNVILLELWKHQTVVALDALTSGVLIPRKNVPGGFLQEADRLIQNRVYPIVIDSGEAASRQDSEEKMVSRMASLQATPVSSPERRIGVGGVQDYFTMPYHVRSASGSAD